MTTDKDEYEHTSKQCPEHGLVNCFHCRKEICCVCGSNSELKCSDCGSTYCDVHYETTVMTGNCCRANEKDYE